MAQGAGGHSMSTRRPKTQGIWRFTTAVASGYIFWALLQERGGEGALGAGQDPSTTLKFRSLAGCAFGWGRCRRLLSSRERGTQGDGRDPNSCSHSPCPREGSRPRGCPSPKRVHGQEPACLHSHGVKPHGDRCHQKAEHEDPSHERHLGEDTELGLPPGRLRGSRV